MRGTRYDHTPEEIAEAYRRHSAWVEEQLAGLEGAEHDAMADEVMDSHSCQEFSVDGGRCAFCGRTVPESPAWCDEHGCEPSWWHDEGDRPEVDPCL